DVHLAPPDVAFGRRLADNELVLRRAPRVLARQHDQWPALGELPLAALQAFLVQRRHVQIPVGGTDGLQSVLLEAVATAGLSDVCLRTFLPCLPLGAFSSGPFSRAPSTAALPVLLRVADC